MLLVRRTRAGLGHRHEADQNKLKGEKLMALTAGHHRRLEDLQERRREWQHNSEQTSRGGGEIFAKEHIEKNIDVPVLRSLKSVWR